MTAGGPVAVQAWWSERDVVLEVGVEDRPADAEVTAIELDAASSLFLQTLRARLNAATWRERASSNLATQGAAGCFLTAGGRIAASTMPP